MNNDELGPFQRVSEAITQPLGWVWNGLIPQGKLTLVTGEAGIGKSLVTLQVATSVTRGMQVPVPPPGLKQKYPPDATMRTAPGAVVLISGNDDLSDTIRPRLESAGADLSLIYHLRDPSALVEADGDDSLSLERDFARLEDGLKQLIDQGVDIRLIVIDPIDAYMSSTIRKVDRRAVVNRLVRLAAWTKAAVLAVASSNSSQTGRVGFRTITPGHRDLAEMARSVLMVAQDLERDDRRIVIPLKLSLGENRSGMSFVIQEGVVEWNAEPVVMTGENYSYQSREKARNPLCMQEQSALNRATEWLYERLKMGGEFSFAIQREAQEHEIAYPTLRRAFKKLGCVSIKTLGPRGKWYWRLPQEVYSSGSLRRELQAEPLEGSILHFVYQWRGNFPDCPPPPPIVPPKYDDDDLDVAQDAQPVQETSVEIPRVIQVYRENGELKFGIPGDEIELGPDDREDDQGDQPVQHEMTSECATI